MPPDRYSSQSTFDMEMLDPQAFFAPDGLKIALRAIEAICHRGDPEIAGMVEALNSRSHILEYIISGMSCLPIGPCEPPALIIFPTSAQGGGVQGTLEVDSYRVPHIRDAKYYGHHEHTPSPTVLIFVANRRISNLCRCAQRPPCIPEKGGTLIQYSEGHRGERQRCIDRGENFSC